MPTSTRYDSIAAQLSTHLPALRPRLRDPLVCALVGMSQAVSAQQRAIASAMPLNTRQQSKIQRLRRLLDNTKLAATDVYQPIVRATLTGLRRQKVHLLLDRVVLTDTQNVLVVSLCFRRRSVPLVWRILAHQGSSTLRDQQQLLLAAKKLLPPGVRITVHADSEFRSQLLFDWLRKRRWNAILGIRGSVYINKLSKAGKSPRTIQYARAILRKALNQAIRWRFITFNAAAVVEGPRVAAYEAKPLTKEEARRLMDSLKGNRLEVLYLMALLLGLRRGEVLGLLISNLDLDAGRVKVEAGLQWQGGKLVRGTTKTKASMRLLPLPPSLIPLLREHLERQQARFPKNTYVFASTAGTPINPRNLLRQFKQVLKRAGLRDIRFHDLRHTAATFLIARGEHPRAVMDILGHSQISTTMNIYGHVLDETRTDAVSGLDRFLSEE